MAPSPELGQPKAPDKVDTKSVPVEVDTSADFGILPKSSSSLTSSSSLPLSSSQSSTAAAVTTLATQQDTENFNSWDDGDLKKLLDEAITYKRPKDREHKSKAFKELLLNAELEDQARDCDSNRVLSRSTRGSNRHTQGGSLQDLVETVHQEHLLESDFVGQTRGRHHHNSRQKKYSSVSSRQREGGSLPSNVNVSFCNLAPYEETFLNEFNRRKIKTDKQLVLSGGGGGGTSVGGIGCINSEISTVNSLIREKDDTVTRTIGSDGKISHTVIEISDHEADETRHLLAHDSLAQVKLIQNGISDPLTGEEIMEMNPMKKLPRVNYTSHQMNVEVAVGEASRSSHNIDKTVQFNSLMKSVAKPIDMNAIQLNNSYVAVNSCIDNKSGGIGSSGGPLTLGSSQNGKFPGYPHVQFISEQKHIDENGNSVPSFNSSLPSASQPNKIKIKSKLNKADRNTKTIIAKEIKGNRGDDNIDALLAFIENKETTKRNGVISGNTVSRSNIIGSGGGGGGCSSGNGGSVSSGDKNKKKNATKKDGGGKLKKSNSLEELKSSSKLEQEIAQSACVQENVVTLRHKQQAKKIAAAAAETMKDTKQQQQNQTQQQQQQSKRGERRSWGTEELSYLGETNSLSKDQDFNQATKEPRKIVKESATTTLTITANTTKTNLNNNNNNQVKKREEHSLSIVSIESISTSSETAEFHVVTKKKKAKKRQILEEARQKQSGRDHGSGNSGGGGNHGNGGGSGGHMHGSHNRGGRYQPSHNYTNDRDVYLTPFNSNDNRRKSTSSVPPSEKSDSSDLDSVHSLPVESSSRLTTVQQTSTSSGSTPQASYADIARISNPDKLLSGTLPMDKWPVVSNKNPESPDTSNMSTCSSLSAKSQVSVRANRFFPEPLSDATIPATIISLSHQQHVAGNSIHDTSSCSSTSSNSTIVKQVTYSQSLIAEDKSNAIDITTSTAPTSFAIIESSSSSSISSGKRSQNIGVTCKINDSQPSSSSSSSSLSLSTTKSLIHTPTVSATLTNNNDCSKTPLQKSKSVDTDHSYTNMNIDNYPALEKTVKPQKQYQSMTAVEMPQNQTKSIKTTVKLATQPFNNAPTQLSLASSSPNASSVNDNSVTVTITTKRANKQQQTSPGNFTKNSKNINEGSAAIECAISQATEKHLIEQNKITDAFSMDNSNVVVVMTTTTTSLASNTTSTISSNTATTKKSTKKDKNHHHYTNNSNRPAVIILNDHSSSNNSDTISPLLFGDFEVEDLRLLEQESDHQFIPSLSLNANNNNSCNADDKSIEFLSSSIDQSISSINSGANRNTSEQLVLSPQSDLGYSSSHNRSTLSSESFDAVHFVAQGPQKPNYPHLPQQQNKSYHQHHQQYNQQKLNNSNSSVSVATATGNICPVVAANFVPIDNIGHNIVSNNNFIVKQQTMIAASTVCYNNNSEPNNNLKQNIKTNNNSCSSGNTISNSNINNNSCSNNSNINTYTSSSGDNNNNNTNRNCSNDNSNSSCGNNNAINSNVDVVTSTTISPMTSTSTVSIAVATTTTTLTATTVTDTITEEILNQSAVTAPNRERLTTCEKELTIRYIAPPIVPNINSYNHDKIVNFVGLAWENIICGINGGAQFYNGQ